MVTRGGGTSGHYLPSRGLERRSSAVQKANEWLRFESRSPHLRPRAAVLDASRRRSP